MALTSGSNPHSGVPADALRYAIDAAIYRYIVFDLSYFRYIEEVAQC